MSATFEYIDVFRLHLKVSMPFFALIDVVKGSFWTSKRRPKVMSFSLWGSSNGKENNCFAGLDVSNDLNAYLKRIPEYIEQHSQSSKLFALVNHLA